LWKPSGFHRVLPPSFWFGYQYGRDNTLFQFPQFTLYDPLFQFPQFTLYDHREKIRDFKENS